MADVRSTRHHGAFGQLVIEPQDSVTLDNRTGEVSVTSVASMIKTGNGDPDFRENALIFADGQFVLNRDDPTDCVVPPGPDIENPNDPCNQLGDSEDQGTAASTTARNRSRAVSNRTTPNISYTVRGFTAIPTRQSGRQPPTTPSSSGWPRG